jgi:hypothetical protein
MRKRVNEEITALMESQKQSQTQAAITLYEKIESGKVILIDPKPPETLLNYLFSQYSTWFWLVTAALASTTINIYLLPQIPPFTWSRVALGFITSLYLPGYAFIEALYPQKKELEELERFALGVGLSIALTPLVGFILNYTPWGIRLNPINTALSVLTIAFGLIGVFRKYQYHILSLEVGY